MSNTYKSVHSLCISILTYCSLLLDRNTPVFVASEHGVIHTLTTFNTWVRPLAHVFMRLVVGGTLISPSCPTFCPSEGAARVTTGLLSSFPSSSEWTSCCCCCRHVRETHNKNDDKETMQSRPFCLCAECDLKVNSKRGNVSVCMMCEELKDGGFLHTAPQKRHTGDLQLLQPALTCGCYTVERAGSFTEFVFICIIDFKDIGSTIFYISPLNIRSSNWRNSEFSSLWFSR